MPHLEVNLSSPTITDEDIWGRDFTAQLFEFTGPSRCVGSGTIVMPHEAVSPEFSGRMGLGLFPDGSVYSHLILYGTEEERVSEGFNNPLLNRADFLDVIQDDGASKSFVVGALSKGFLKRRIYGENADNMRVA